MYCSLRHRLQCLGLWRLLRESRDFYNSLSLTSEVTIKFLKCLEDRSTAVCSHSSEVITETLICLLPDCAFGMRAS